MVPESVDPNVMAQQALRWYSGGAPGAAVGGEMRAPAAPSSGVVQEASGREHQMVASPSASSNVVPTSLEPGRKFYLFCGLPADAAKRGARGGPGAFEEVDGLLGRGVYCSVSLEIARFQGPDVLVVRVVPGGPEDAARGCDFAGLKVGSGPDPAGHWRDEGFAGCWLPLGLQPIMDPKGEICVRAEAIVKATLHDPNSWLSPDRSGEVGKTQWLLAGGLRHPLQRWRYQAQLVRWPVAGCSLTAGSLALLLLRFGFLGSAAGAAAVAAVFGLSAV